MSENVKADVNVREAAQAPGHARHDRLLVVRYAAGDVDGADLQQATAQVDQCADCARLAADINSLHASLAAMPAPRRTRDFRITQEQAEHLRGSAFDRFLRRLAMPKLGILRPVAGVGVALGLVIAAVGGVPSAYLATSAGAPPPAAIQATSGPTSQNRDTSGAADAASPSYAESVGETGAQGPAYSAAPAAFPTGTAKYAPSDSPMYVTLAPTASATATHAAAIQASPTATEALVTAPTSTNSSETDDTGRLLLVYAGLTLAIVAFGLLLLSLYARRRNEDPLLR